ncbi:MAG: hypothetical protein HC837_09015 [Chloroflexaceae bacterium]|nr:hypothetical protein [Chloroflexaceae bacterium]
MVLSYDSIMAVNQLIMVAFGSWYIIRLPHKAQSTWWFAAFFVGMLLSSTGFLVETLIPTGSESAYALQVVLNVAAMGCLVQMVYHLPLNDQPGEQRTMLLLWFVLLGIALVLLLLIVAAPLGMVSLPTSVSLNLLSLLLPLMLGLSIVVMVRRTIALSGYWRRPERSVKGMVWVLLHPVGRNAIMVRAFLVMLLLSTLPMTLILLHHMLSTAVPFGGYLTAMSIVCFYLGMFLVFLHYGGEASSFLERVFCVALVLLLGLFGIVTLMTTGMRNEQFQQKRGWQVALVEQALIDNNLSKLPAEVAYNSAY